MPIKTRELPHVLILNMTEAELLELNFLMCKPRREGQLSVSGERMGTILVNRLED